MNEQKIVSVSVFASVLLLIATVAGYFLFLPPQLPLFYSLARTQDQLVRKEWLFVVPALAIVITLLQMPFVRLRGIEEHATTVKVFVLASTFLVFLLGVAFVRIVLLVT